ncbi:phosphatidylserine decarboxylase-domain-containing protein [Geopyxis carbonaria]|nr:phosphatidylserine decarboxylase-domain-containing protein [Geopyxis carbonaria]
MLMQTDGCPPTWSVGYICSPLSPLMMGPSFLDHRHHSGFTHQVLFCSSTTDRFSSLASDCHLEVPPSELLEPYGKLHKLVLNKAVHPPFPSSAPLHSAMSSTTGPPCPTEQLHETATTWHPLIHELSQLIKDNDWTPHFTLAISTARASSSTPVYAAIDSLPAYLNYLNNFITWLPSESTRGDTIYTHICAFYHILSQPSIAAFQTPVHPLSTDTPLTALSAWCVEYARAIGTFYDTPQSLTPAIVQSFYDCPAYHMKDYTVPLGGWRSFNDFWARSLRPGVRPQTTGARVITSPADSTFAGSWPVNSEGSVVFAKGVPWRVRDLLCGDDSGWQDGTWCHMFLSTTDYHRVHAPVSGIVISARVIPGAVYCQVRTGGSGELEMDFVAPNEPGYQFLQTRGCVVIYNQEVGKIAMLPIGMGHVSSVVLTVSVGDVVKKGDEVGYFQFGGSDVVIVVEKGVEVNAQSGKHYKVGEAISKGKTRRLKL